MPVDREIRLRGNRGAYAGPWPIGEIPDLVIYGIGEQLVHRLAIGHADITGDDFGEIFAKSANGQHRASPLGVADVVANGTAWSVKTVKSNSPLAVRKARLISGRNSPDYSLGIDNPRADIQATGRAVLSIWNARINESLDHHDELRIAVFIRNMDKQQFCLFECPATIFPADDYRWLLNNGGNLEGHEIATGIHCFTWQPHGSQFTIIRSVPGSARTFSINRTIPIVSPEHVLRLVRYEHDWITIG